MSMWLVANEMESPFGTGANSLDLRAYHRQFVLSLSDMTNFDEADWWTTSKGTCPSPQSCIAASGTAALSSLTTEASSASATAARAAQLDRSSFVQDAAAAGASTDAPPSRMRKGGSNGVAGGSRSACTSGCDADDASLPGVHALRAAGEPSQGRRRAAQDGTGGRRASVRSVRFSSTVALTCLERYGFRKKCGPL